MIRQWIQQLAKQLRGPKSAPRSRRPNANRTATVRPGCEALEDRLVPAGLLQASFHPTYLIFHQANNASKAQAHSAPAALGSAYGYTPAQIRTAYGIGSISLGGTAGTGAGQTIAIVDAYNDPTVLKDLDTFDQTFGASGTSGTTLYQQYGVASSFLTVYNQNGQVINPSNTTVPVDSTGGWEGEESLDVQWAHSIAPGAKIDLVVCNSASMDLYTGVQAAANLPGVSVVSMSWSGNDQSGENSLDSYFTTPAGHQGVTFLASTGDYSASGYPAYSANVIAVGGTSLTLNAANGIQSESGWSTGSDGSGTGGGTSQFETEPAYQEGVQHTGFRTNPDVSFVADPNTGVPVYDTYDNSGWFQVGGTSLSCPSWAGLMAIANQGRTLQGKATFNSSTNPQEALTALYKLPSSDFHDITSGTITANGHTYSAGSGYDEVTGIGTPIANVLIPALAGYGSSPSPTASQLAFTTEPPTSVAIGSTFSTVVQLENSSGSAVAVAGVSVTIAISPGLFSAGTTTMTVASNASGQAVFSNLAVGTAGRYTLAASSAGLTGAQSTSLVVGQSGEGDWFSKNIPDPSLQILARSDFNLDGRLTFSDMLGLLDTAVTEGAVSTAVMQSLTALADNPGTLRLPSNVSDLTNKVVNGDPANATYQYLNSQGNVQTVSLGNLKVGSSAGQLQELVNKWFLGMNEPTASAAYSAVRGSLFGSAGPVYTDIEQGALGDCTVMASLAETAARDNSALKGMFIYDGTNVVNGAKVGVWTVRFYRQGAPTYVTVDGELPAGGGLYDHPSSGVLWAALAEKAYAELNQSGWLATLSPGIDSYQALNNGNENTAVTALSAFTGLSASAFSFNASTVASAMQQGKLVVLGTGNTVANSFIVNNHAYAVVGYNAASSMPFAVFNPWGINGGYENGEFKWGQFTANGAFLAANFVFSGQTNAGPVGVLASQGSRLVSQAMMGNVGVDKSPVNAGGPETAMTMAQSLDAIINAVSLGSEAVDCGAIEAYWKQSDEGLGVV